MAPIFRTLRQGIDIGWDLGRNFYRGPNVKEFGLLRGLDKLSLLNQYMATEFGGVTGRHFPPDFNVNDWVENEFVYPMPYMQLRYLSPLGYIVVIDPGIPPSEAFPPSAPVPPEELPDIFTTVPVEGLWLYDPVEWTVIGKVMYYHKAERGHKVWSKVDSCWVVWNGASWRPFLRSQIRSMEVSATRPRTFLGGFLMIYVAVDEFVIPQNMAGSTGIATANGQVDMEVQRNGVTFGSLVFPPNGRMYGSSGAPVTFSPGDRLSIYAGGNTQNMKEVNATIKGIYL